MPELIPVEPVYSFYVDDTRLKAQLRTIQGQFRSTQGAIYRANERSVEWLSKRASGNLKAKTHRYPDARNRTRLAQIVANPRSSVINSTGFEFLVEERIAALAERARRYYRVIEGAPEAEFGSTYWVGRRVRLTFYGPPGRNFQAARPNRAAEGVLIEHGVPAYHYAVEARESFVKSRLWWRYAYQELDALGIKARP